MESEVPGSIITRGNILLLEFFVRPLTPILALFCQFRLVCEKLYCGNSLNSNPNFLSGSVSNFWSLPERVCALKIQLTETGGDTLIMAWVRITRLWDIFLLHWSAALGGSDADYLLW